MAGLFWTLISFVTVSETLIGLYMKNLAREQTLHFARKYLPRNRSAGFREVDPRKRSCGSPTRESLENNVGVS
jgi:hypothetical protein